jgi:hypothetical protein
VKEEVDHEEIKEAVIEPHSEAVTEEVKEPVTVSVVN